MTRFGRCNFAAVGGSVFNAEICSYMNITTGWNCFQSVLIKVSGQLPISLAETRKPLNSQKKMETGLDAAVAAVLPGIECIVSLNEDATAVFGFSSWNRSFGFIHPEHGGEEHSLLCANSLV